LIAGTQMAQSMLRDITGSLTALTSGTAAAQALVVRATQNETSRQLLELLGTLRGLLSSAKDQSQARSCQRILAAVDFELTLVRPYTDAAKVRTRVCIAFS
jgi:hypothetical protein